MKREAKRCIAWAVALGEKEGALALCALSGGALWAAYVAETFLNVAPCSLCVMQRVPYALVVFLSALAVGAAVLRAPRVTRGFLLLCALAFLVNAGLAFFHSGVERFWWEGTDGCAVNPLVVSRGDPAATRAALMAAPVVRCDEINFTFFGLTMANWNVPASLTFAALALFFLRRRPVIGGASS